jgi:hypothetical protein
LIWLKVALVKGNLFFAQNILRCLFNSKKSTTFAAYCVVHYTTVVFL